MLNKLKESIIAIVKQLAIAFFFATIIILVSGIFLNDKIKLAFSLVSNFAVEGKIGEEVEVKFDILEKRLSNYPPYGTYWGRLKIPAINLNEKLIHGDDLPLIKKDIGHYVGSYFPGEGGTVLLAAHNSRKHFMYIPKIPIGHHITIETDYGTFTYEVYKKDIILDTREDLLPIQKDKEILIMYTCYPTNSFGHKNKRYVVYSKLINSVYKGGNK